eukprot:m.109480 g.109480  ORF g.109480 m.109480 type:complete len:272 (-) comp14003_c2_seq2:35-850(-)
MLGDASIAKTVPTFRQVSFLEDLKAYRAFRRKGSFLASTRSRCHFGPQQQQQQQQYQSWQGMQMQQGQYYMEPNMDRGKRKLGHDRPMEMPQSYKRPRVQLEEYKNDETKKPPYAYTFLIYHAIKDSGKDKVTLGEIYSKIMEDYAYYRARSNDTAWKNSIRHNLTMHKSFIKVPRTQGDSGKGGYWRVDDDVARTEVAFDPKPVAVEGTTKKKKKKKSLDQMRNGKRSMWMSSEIQLKKQRDLLALQSQNRDQFSNHKKLRIFKNSMFCV